MFASVVLNSVLTDLGLVASRSLFCSFSHQSSFFPSIILSGCDTLVTRKTKTFLQVGRHGTLVSGMEISTHVIDIVT